MSGDFEVVDEEPWRHKISLLVEGKKASWLTVIDMRMHYGQGELTAGGIAGVYTPREFRRKGYSKKTINYALEWMKSKGCSLSALFGIHDYYEQFDFAVFAGEYTVSLNLRNAAMIKPPAVRHPITLSDDAAYRFEEIRQLYEENNRHRVGSRVRSPGLWKGFRKGVAWEHEPNLLIAGEKDMLGYAVVDRWPSAESLTVAEMEAKEHDYDVYRSLLNELYRLMTERLTGSLTVYLPPDHPLINLLQTSGCKLQCNYPSNSGAMAHVLSLKLAVTEAKAELEQRSKGLEGEVCLCVPGEDVTIAVEDGSVELRDNAATSNRIKLGRGEVAQMIFGYRDAREILSSIEAHGNLTLLEHLFPKKTPYVWQPDRW